MARRKPPHPEPVRKHRVRRTQDVDPTELTGAPYFSVIAISVLRVPARRRSTWTATQPS